MSSTPGASDSYPSWEQIEAQFASPQLRYRPRPLWFWNNTTITDEGICEQIRAMRDRCGYGGFGIVPFGRAMRPAYLSEEYFDRYRTVLETAASLGMTVSLYDEYGFPSGSAGSRNSSDVSAFARSYPERTLHRLDKIERMVTGPCTVELPLPDGRVEAVVAMDALTLRRVVVDDAVVAGPDGGRVARWAAPPGIWQVMAFVCVVDGEEICDYLDPEATRGFVELTHEEYAKRFARHFGATIDSTFHDEPTLYRAQGRTWTPRFADEYRSRYGEDPRALYPALWYDIGEETAGARHRLFGLRTRLYAEAFAGELDAWAASHGIVATGHQDQEEVENPVSVSGDLIGCFRHQTVPGIDKIGGDRPAERFYRLVASAAVNWDRPLVMSETYGTMGDMDMGEITRVALEQYTAGINDLIPHAVWYDPEQVVFRPELSWRNPLYADHLPQLTTLLARLNLLLRNDGAHVPDIAVLYPVDGLEAAHHFDGELGPYRGGVAVPESNYANVAAELEDRLGLDFVFLHPDVIAARCTVQSGAIELANRVHPGRFPVLVMPASRAVRPAVVDAVEALLGGGGAVIAVGMLPWTSSDPWADAEAARRLGRTIEESPRALHVERPEEVGAALERVHPLPDARVRPAPRPRSSARAGSPLAAGPRDPGRRPRVLHKRYRGRDLYVVANLDNSESTIELVVRGAFELEEWDPHRGGRRMLQANEPAGGERAQPVADDAPVAAGERAGAATAVTIDIPANEARVIVAHRGSPVRRTMTASSRRSVR